MASSTLRARPLPRAPRVTITPPIPTTGNGSCSPTADIGDDGPGKREQPPVLAADPDVPLLVAPLQLFAVGAPRRRLAVHDLGPLGRAHALELARLHAADCTRRPRLRFLARAGS